MRTYRTQLASWGHAVTSRWIDPAESASDECTPEQMNADPESCAPHASVDLADVSQSDALICFTEWPSSTGGRHVEFGYALALGIRIVMIGPREHIFHTLPQVEHFPDWVSFAEAAPSGAVAALECPSLIPTNPYAPGANDVPLFDLETTR
jgi:hypothetical protein